MARPPHVSAPAATGETDKTVVLGKRNAVASSAHEERLAAVAGGSLGSVAPEMPGPAKVTLVSRPATTPRRPHPFMPRNRRFSPDQLEAELNVASVAGGGDHSEVRRRDVLRHTEQVRVVQRVERLQPELESGVPGQREVLEEAQVQIADAGSTQDAPARVAERAKSGLRESRRVEPLRDGSAARVDVAYDVRTVGTEAIE